MAGKLDKIFLILSALNFFIVVASAAGLIFVFLIPPFQGGDEPLHFYRAYQVSEGNFIVDSNPGNDYGGVLPTSLSKTVALTTNNSSLGNLRPDEKYDIHKTSQALSIKQRPNDKQWTNFTATALYSPVAYIPQALGVLTARLLDLPPILMMYAGRLMNLAVWIILIALSIRFIPRQKWGVAFIGLLPVPLSQASSLSADIMTVGLFAVFLALCLNWRHRAQDLTNRELAGLLALAIVMALCKQIMIVLLPLVLLIPGRNFKSIVRAHAWKAALTLVPVAFYTSWLYLIRTVDLKSVFSHHQNPGAQISFIIHKPYDFVAALWHTYFFKFGDNITHSFIGTFGWGDTSLAEVFVIIGYVGLVLALATGPSRQFRMWLSIQQKSLVSLVGLLYFLAVSAALYVYYNPVGASTIAGLQGRYFLPLGLLSVPLLYGDWLKIKPWAYLKIVVLLPILLLVASVITISARYY